MDYILDRTLLRPRDVIAFYKECLRQADGKTNISWDNIVQAEKIYSNNRLLALRDEWKGTYPGIAQVFEVFRGSSTRMDRSEVARRLEDAALLTADPKFEGTKWLSEHVVLMMSATKETAWEQTHLPLLELLFRVGLLSASSKPSDRPIGFSDNPHLMATVDDLSKLASFVVNRPYQAALGVAQSRQ